MKSVMIAALLLGLSFACANAQTAAPEPDADVDAMSAVATPSGQPPVKQVREHCRAEAEAQGLKGQARRAALQRCILAARPDLAIVMKCRKEGKERGLTGEALHDYVKTCKRGA